MLKLATAILVTCTLCLQSTQAEDLSGFKKYFSLIKNEGGNVTHVRMNFSKSKLSLKPYLNQVKNDVKKEIERMRSKSGDQAIDSLFTHLEEGMDKTYEADENIYVLRGSFAQLKKIDIDKFFSMASTKGVLTNFRVELEKALRMFDLAVIASTEDSRYFYKRNVNYAVLKKAIDYAKKKFTNIPLLNLVSYIMVEVHALVLEQRLFHQNMLLHYLNNVDEGKLGLTVSEVDRMFSSIYESRIGTLNRRESTHAVNTWKTYGHNIFYASVRVANTKLRRSMGTFDEVGQRLNFAFFIAKEKGEKVVKNLFHTKHKYSSKMATAYNFERPDQVRRFRSLLSLGKLGLSFVNIPGWLKGQVESFIDSYYVDQKRLEGALIAHFDINGNQVMSEKLREQLINPYIHNK